MILPGETSAPGDFLMNALILSDWRILLTDPNNPSLETLEFVDGTTNVPLPASLPLLASVLGLGWLTTRFRRLREALVARTAVAAA
jgi:hypothetical protein